MLTWSHYLDHVNTVKVMFWAKFQHLGRSGGGRREMSGGGSRVRRVGKKMLGVSEKRDVREVGEERSWGWERSDVRRVGEEICHGV